MLDLSCKMKHKTQQHEVPAADVRTDVVAVVAAVASGETRMTGFCSDAAPPAVGSCTAAAAVGHTGPFTATSRQQTQTKLWYFFHIKQVHNS